MTNDCCDIHCWYPPRGKGLCPECHPKRVTEIEVLRKGYLNLWRAWKAHCAAGFLAEIDEYDDLIGDARAAGIEPTSQHAPGCDSRLAHLSDRPHDYTCGLDAARREAGE